MLFGADELTMTAQEHKLQDHQSQLETSSVQILCKKQKELCFLPSGHIWFFFSGGGIKDIQIGCFRHAMDFFLLLFFFLQEQIMSSQYKCEATHSNTPGTDANDKTADLNVLNVFEKKISAVLLSIWELGRLTEAKPICHSEKSLNANRTNQKEMQYKDHWQRFLFCPDFLSCHRQVDRLWFLVQTKHSLSHSLVQTFMFFVICLLLLLYSIHYSSQNQYPGIRPRVKESMIFVKTIKWAKTSRLAEK